MIKLETQQKVQYSLRVTSCQDGKRIKHHEIKYDIDSKTLKAGSDPSLFGILEGNGRILDEMFADQMRPDVKAGRLSSEEAFHKIAAFAVNKEEVRTTLHWMIRHFWNPKHKFPDGCVFKDSCKAKGLWLKHLLILCQQCHNILVLSGGKVKYPNPSAWFLQIVIDLSFSGINKTLLEIYPDTHTANHQTKREIVRVHHQICSRVKSFSSVRSDKHSALLSLLTIAMGIAESRDFPKFKTDYYDEFTKAWRDMIDELDKRHVRTFRDAKGGIRIQDGKGKYSYPITKIFPNYSEILRLLESSPDKHSSFCSKQ